MDDVEAQKRFKEELKASFPFIADADGTLVRLYDVKMVLLSRASRTTFVIGEGRKVLEVQEGSDAIDPSGAIKACPLRRPPPAAR